MSPVTLVATVVSRNMAVNRGKRIAASMASTTTIPEKMPIRLKSTWN
jgi:hypothetical protein